MKRLMTLTALTFAFISGEAMAHAKLTTSQPSAGSTGPAPAALVLDFNEVMEPAFSGLTLTGAAPVAVKTVVKDKRMTATPAARLSPGSYEVKWHALTADGHKVKGGYRFTVK